jgi:hypothetical protein
LQAGECGLGKCLPRSARRGQGGVAHRFRCAPGAVALASVPTRNESAFGRGPKGACDRAPRRKK